MTYDGFKCIGTLVQVDPKLPDDSGEVPKPNKVVGGLILGREIISLLDKKLVK